MKTLYVENHERFSRIVTEQFLAGHEITITPRMSEANALMEEEDFDLVLVDYDLDDGKGAEIAFRIVASESRSRVIAVSSRGDGNDFMM